MNMIIKINGNPLCSQTALQKTNFNLEEIKLSSIWSLNKTGLKRIAITLWTFSGIIISQSAGATGKGTSLFLELLPVFGILKEVSAILGTLAIFAGLVVAIFRKNLGMKIVTGTLFVMLACFLVPSAVMLLAIIGNSLDGKLQAVFKSML